MGLVLGIKDIKTLKNRILQCERDLMQSFGLARQGSHTYRASELFRHVTATTNTGLGNSTGGKSPSHSNTSSTYSTSVFGHVIFVGSRWCIGMGVAKFDLCPAPTQPVGPAAWAPRSRLWCLWFMGLRVWSRANYPHQDFRYLGVNLNSRLHLLHLSSTLSGGLE